jgi:hypothetical protein
MRSEDGCECLMAQMWKGELVVHFIVVAGGVFFWCSISSCANCYDKQPEYFIAAGSRTASWSVFSQPVISQSVEVI